MKIAEIGLHFMSLLTLQAIQWSKESVIFAKSKDLKRTSIITKKLSFFIREFVIFESTSLQEAMF